MKLKAEYSIERVDYDGRDELWIYTSRDPTHVLAVFGVPEDRKTLPKGMLEFFDLEADPGHQ